MAKARAKNPYRIFTVEGKRYYVRLPRRQRNKRALSALQRNLIAAQAFKTTSAPQDCTIFFPRGGGAVQRCEAKRGRKRKGKRVKVGGLKRAACRRPMPCQVSAKGGRHKRIVKATATGGCPKGSKRYPKRGCR